MRLRLDRVDRHVEALGDLAKRLVAREEPEDPQLGDRQRRRARERALGERVDLRPGLLEAALEDHRAVGAPGEPGGLGQERASLARVSARPSAARASMIRASAPYHGMKSPSAASRSVASPVVVLGFVGAALVCARSGTRGEGERTDRILGEPGPLDHRAGAVRRVGGAGPVVLLDRQHRQLRQAQRRNRRNPGAGQRDAALQGGRSGVAISAEMQRRAEQQLGVGAPGAVLGLEIARARGRRQHRIGAGGPGHRFGDRLGAAERR